MGRATWPQRCTINFHNTRLLHSCIIIDYIYVKLTNKQQVSSKIKLLDNESDTKWGKASDCDWTCHCFLLDFLFWRLLGEHDRENW